MIRGSHSSRVSWSCHAVPHRWYRRFARRTTPKPQYCSAALLSAGAKAGTPRIRPAGAASLFDPAAAGCFKGYEEEVNKVDPTVEHARFWLPMVKRPKGDRRRGRTRASHAAA